VVRNAVLILHGTGGSGASLMKAEFAGELFAPGQPLDAARFFIVLPDGIGHGKSSKPSDGLHARFPRYGYQDMVEAEFRLLTQGLHVNHARLVMGTSMGACIPGCGVSGTRNSWTRSCRSRACQRRCPAVTVSGGAWSSTRSATIRRGRAESTGTQPPSLRTAIEMIWLVGSNPVLRQQEAPTRAQADQVIDSYVNDHLHTEDANDILYAVEASHDYDPGPALERIEAPLLAINSADDLINPPSCRSSSERSPRAARPRDSDTVQRAHTWAWLAHLCVLWSGISRSC